MGWLMTLKEAKQEIDGLMASLFYERMKNVSVDESKSQEVYRATVNEMSQLLLHMKGRLDILFGKDPDALSKFLLESGVLPSQEN
jgi:hypothetical protein